MHFYLNKNISNNQQLIYNYHKKHKYIHWNPKKINEERRMKTTKSTGVEYTQRKNKTKLAFALLKKTILLKLDFL